MLSSIVMRIFKVRSFAKFAEKQYIDDSTLIEVIQRAELGLIDANLGKALSNKELPEKGRENPVVFVR